MLERELVLNQILLMLQLLLYDGATDCFSLAKPSNAVTKKNQNIFHSIVCLTFRVIVFLYTSNRVNRFFHC